MFDFLKKIAGGKRHLGIDIGTTSLKIAEIERAGDRFEFKNYGYLESFDYLDRPNAAFQTSTLQLEEEAVAKYIRYVMDKSGIKEAPVVASLPMFSMFSTLIETPALRDAEITQFVGLQARQYIPVPLDDATLDWIKVGERVDEEGNKKTQIFLISVPNRVIARYQKIFSLANLDLRFLEVEGLSAARVLTANESEPVLIIDVGARSSSILIGEKGLLKFAGQTDFAGATLTQAIANGLGVSARRAEDLKRRRGLISGGGGQELFTLLEPMVDVIINEGRRIKTNYETSYKIKVSKLILSGGGAKLPGFLQYAGKELGVQAFIAEPFKGASYSKEFEPLVPDLNPLFSIAIGLSLKNI